MAAASITLTVVGARGAMRLTLVGARGAMRLTLVGAIGLSFVGAMGLTLVGARGAHHSVLPFDGSTATTIEGKVVRVLWQNPHAMISVDVDSNHWTIESESTAVLQRLGWTSTSIKAGDRITITGARAKDGRHLMRCKVITLTDGRQVPCFS